jgi:hypothetical protein
MPNGCPNVNIVASVALTDEPPQDLPKTRQDDKSFI